MSDLCIRGDATDIDGNQVLTGCFRETNQLNIWDLRKDHGTKHFDPLLTIPFESDVPEKLYVAKFGVSYGEHVGRFVIAGGTGANEVRVFDRNRSHKLKEVHKSEGAVFAASCAPTGMVAIAEQGGGIDFMSIRIEEQMEGRGRGASVSGLPEQGGKRRVKVGVRPLRSKSAPATPDNSNGGAAGKSNETREPESIISVLDSEK